MSPKYLLGMEAIHNLVMGYDNDLEKFIQKVEPGEIAISVATLTIVLADNTLSEVQKENRNVLYKLFHSSNSVLPVDAEIFELSREIKVLLTEQLTDTDQSKDTIDTIGIATAIKGFHDIALTIVDYPQPEVYQLIDKRYKLPRLELKRPVSEKAQKYNFTKSVPIPEPEPGLTFTINDDLKFSFAMSGKASIYEINQLEVIKKNLRIATDDLISSLAGTNAHVSILEHAQNYKETLNSAALSIDQLYATGLRLENTYDRLKNDNDYPDLQYQSGESFDSLIALHGIFITSTQRGRTLLDRASQYTQNRKWEEDYKKVAVKFAEAISRESNLIEEKVRATLIQLNSDIGCGPHPNRTTDIARSTNRNFIIASATTIAGLCGSAILGNVVTTSIPGNELVSSGKDVVDLIWNFFVNNHVLLREFIAVSGADMTWLSAFLNCIQNSSFRNEKK